MLNEIPISMLKKNGAYLIYFETCKINEPNKIESAYIKARQPKCNKAVVSINENLSEEDKILLQKYKQSPPGDGCDYNILANVSDVVKMIASGYVENKGFLLEGVKYLCNPRLTLCYSRDKIYPGAKSSFFEDKIRLLSYAKNQESPWFYTGRSDTVTFFVHNKSGDSIVIHLENSPDSVRIVKDAQKIHVQPEETVDIVPYKFSKYTRITASSEKPEIDCDIWFNTQLRCHCD